MYTAVYHTKIRLFSINFFFKTKYCVQPEIFVGNKYQEIAKESSKNKFTSINNGIGVVSKIYCIKKQKIETSE